MIPSDREVGEFWFDLMVCGLLGDYEFRGLDTPKIYLNKPNYALTIDVW